MSISLHWLTPLQLSTSSGTRKILHGTKAKTFTSIPIIDLTNIDSPSLEVRKAFAQELYDACSNVGFFYTKGHGVSEELVAQTFDYIKIFYSILFFRSVMR